MSACKCALCRRRFTSLAGFDRHQDSGQGARASRCLDPASIGMEQNAAGRWHLPQDAAGARRLAKILAERGRGDVIAFPPAADGA
jgi:hypothetical protein